MRKIIYSIALAFVVAAAVFGPVATAYAAVPSGIDALINGGDINNPGGGTTTYSGAKTVAFTFVGDMFDNYTNLILWIIAIAGILTLIIGLARRFMFGGGRR